MIDPNKVTQFDRNPHQLMEFLLFCICAAGKTAIVQAQKLDQFLKDVDPSVTGMQADLRCWVTKGETII